MTRFILGTKAGMTQIVDRGVATPVTVIRVEPNVVIQVKSKEKDGYEAVQVGTGTKRRVAKPQRGHFGDLGTFRFVREFRATKGGDKELAKGDTLDASIFTPGDTVKVAGISKGKGFQGGVKRHGFSGMPESHGHHHVRKHIGSIGQRFPQHTLKGKRMAGHMGAERVTMRGLKVLTVDAEQGLLAVKGSVPGQKGTLLEVVGQ
ncbi:MAG: 50S ribosomal protein L3 [Patescibacteria group bacterium]